MKNKSIATLLRRAAVIGVAACPLLPGTSLALSNMSDAAIQGALWGSMSINWVNYGNATTQVTAPSGEMSEMPAGDQKTISDDTQQSETEKKPEAGR